VLERGVQRVGLQLEHLADPVLAEVHGAHAERNDGGRAAQLVEHTLVRARRLLEPLDVLEVLAEWLLVEVGQRDPADDRGEVVAGDERGGVADAVERGGERGVGGDDRVCVERGALIDARILLRCRSVLRLLLVSRAGCFGCVLRSGRRVLTRINARTRHHPHAQLLEHRLAYRRHEELSHLRSRDCARFLEDRRNVVGDEVGDHVT
jgi:hypothetical protein